MSDSVRPHRRQPTRLPCPWDSPGKNTGVGCHFLLQCMKVKSESEVTQSCPTLHDPMDCSPPGSSVHGIFHARVLGVECHHLLRLFLLSTLKETICTHNLVSGSVFVKTKVKIKGPFHRPSPICWYLPLQNLALTSCFEWFRTWSKLPNSDHSCSFTYSPQNQPLSSNLTFPNLSCILFHLVLMPLRLPVKEWSWLYVLLPEAH